MEKEDPMERPTPFEPFLLEKGSLPFAVSPLDTLDTLDTRSGNSSIGLYRELSRSSVLSVQGVQPGSYPSTTVQLRNR
jgi:hypothetical protein